MRRARPRANAHAPLAHKKPRKSAIPCEWDCPLVFPVVCVCAETSRVPSPRSFLFFPHVKAGSSSPFSLNLRQARSVLPPPPLKQWELKEPTGRRSIPVTWTPSTYPPRKRSSRCVPTTPRSRVSSRRFYVFRVFFGRDPPPLTFGARTSIKHLSRNKETRLVPHKIKPHRTAHLIRASHRIYPPLKTTCIPS